MASGCWIVVKSEAGAAGLLRRIVLVWCRPEKARERIRDFESFLAHSCVCKVLVLSGTTVSSKHRRRVTGAKMH